MPQREPSAAQCCPGHSRRRYPRNGCGGGLTPQLTLPLNPLGLPLSGLPTHSTLQGRFRHGCVLVLHGATGASLTFGPPSRVCQSATYIVLCSTLPLSSHGKGRPSSSCDETLHYLVGRISLVNCTVQLQQAQTPNCSSKLCFESLPPRQLHNTHASDHDHDQRPTTNESTSDSDSGTRAIFSLSGSSTIIAAIQARQSRADSCLSYLPRGHRTTQLGIHPSSDCRCGHRLPQSSPSGSKRYRCPPTTIPLALWLRTRSTRRPTAPAFGAHLDLGPCPRPDDALSHTESAQGASRVNERASEADP